MCIMYILEALTSQLMVEVLRECYHAMNEDNPDHWLELCEQFLHMCTENWLTDLLGLTELLSDLMVLSINTSACTGPKKNHM